jgi:hypothetical protein
MSNHDHETNKDKSGKDHRPTKPPMPDPGKNPDFPEPDPTGSGGGIKISAE